MQNTNYNIKDEESYNLELDSQAEHNKNNLILIDTHEDYLPSKNTKHRQLYQLMKYQVMENI